MSGSVAIIFASASLVSGALSGGSGQDPATASWRPPVVTPFEAPSNFGRERSQGDGGAASGRWTGGSPSGIDYEARIRDRETAMDALSGSLDGTWRVLDRRGRLIGQMVLSQSADDGAVTGAVAMGGHDGYVSGAADEHGRAVLFLADGRRMTLHRDGALWVGETRDGGLGSGVTLTR